MDRDARLAYIANKLRWLDEEAQSGGGEKKRVILMMSKPETEEALAGLDAIKFHPVSQNKDLVKSVPDKNLLLDERVVNISGVPNVSDIVIYPYTTAHVMERGLIETRTVPRSRAEIWHRARSSHGLGNRPQAYLLITKDELKSFPEDYQFSETHILHLHSVLLRGMLLWEGCSVVELPLSLHRNMFGVDEMVQRLYWQGLITMDCANVRADVSNGLGFLYGDAGLTDVGRHAARLLTLGRIESVNSACLLGQLLSKEGREQFGLILEGPVIDAIFALSAITETTDGHNTLSNAVMLTDEDKPRPHQWYKDSLSGVAADQVFREPIWLAVAIWQKLRDNRKWRGYWQAFEQTMCQGAHDLIKANQNSLAISRHISIHLDITLEKMKKALATDMPLPELEQNSRLTAQNVPSILHL